MCGHLAGILIRAFAVLEAFTSTLPPTSPIKSTLNAALRQGKGVFKSFRQVLLSDPALFRLFQEFKRNAMLPVIAQWYADIEEHHRLEALREEPEDISDIVAAEIDFRVAHTTLLPFPLAPFIAACVEEYDATLPFSVRQHALAKFIANSTHQTNCILLHLQRSMVSRRYLLLLFLLRA